MDHDIVPVLRNRLKEAEYLLKIAEAKRNAVRTEEILIAYRLEEANSRVHLCRLLAHRAKNKLEDLNLNVGRARLSVEDAQNILFATTHSPPIKETAEPTKKRSEQFSNVKRPKCKYCILCMSLFFDIQDLIRHSRRVYPSRNRGCCSRLTRVTFVIRRPQSLAPITTYTLTVTSIY
jgi:hypothetical protein